MAATETIPFCGSCGWDQTGLTKTLNNDVYCDACGADLNRFGFANLYPPNDLVAATGTDEVIFTWTVLPDTSDIGYSIDGAAFVLDDNATSPYQVAAAPPLQVRGTVRTVYNSVEGGIYAPIQKAFAGQSPPTSLTAVAGSLEVSFTFTADPAADSTDLLYDIDGGDSVLVTGVTSGVVVVAAEGEVVSGQVRTIQIPSTGLYSTADSETALA